MQSARSPATPVSAHLAAIFDAALPDQRPEQSLSCLAHLAARTMDVPVVLVTLVEVAWGLFEGQTLLPKPWDSGEHPVWPQLDASGEPLLIEDARAHPTAGESPFAARSGLVAYAGVPIRASGGELLGGLWAADRQPRRWTRAQADLLSEFATVAAGELDPRVALRSERRRAEELGSRFEAELAAASRFRTIVERSLVGIYLVQGDRVLYANARLKEIFGYPPDEPASHLRVPDLVAEEDRARVEENIRRRMEGEVESLHYTVRGVRRDGARIDVEVYGTRTEIDGEPAVIGSLLDVTERTRVEKALRESEERLRLVERATNDVIWDWNVRTGEVVWNAAGPRAFRYRPEEVGTGIEWHHQKIHPEDQERVIGRLQEVLSGAGEVWSDEYRFLRGDGRYAVVLDRGFVVRNGRGEPVRVIGSMMDVTERRRAEEAQRFLARASTLLDASLDYETALPGLARLTLTSLADFCLIDVVDDRGEVVRMAAAHANPAQERLLTPGSRDDPEADPLRLTIRKVVRTGEAVLVPECSDSVLGRIVASPEHRSTLRGLGLCSLMVVPMVIGDRTLGAVTLGLSSSGRRYASTDLLTAEDLAHRVAAAIDHAQLYRKVEQAVRAREEVLGVISHDLRSPLHAIQMCATLLQDTQTDRRSENQRWIEMIRRTSDQMRSLIDNLLDVSSMEGGHFAVERASHDVAALVGEAYELLQPLAGEKSIRLECEVAEGLSTARVDSPQILRVFSNLVGNAVKFTPEGGTIRVRAELRPGEVRFSVSDTGPGITAEHLPHVFDRYWQARPGDRRGAGLGLAIAKGIVEAHGGRIWAESRPGEGSTFYFTLPADDLPAGGADAEPTPTGTTPPPAR